jgi:hypothetical protein
MEESSEELPIRDSVLAFTGAALTAHSTAGGVLAGLLAQLIPTTLQAKQEAAIKKLDEGLKRLEGRLNDQKIRSEAFHIMLLRTLHDSIVEPEEDKEEAFRAILLNEALSPSPNAESNLFIKITEDLTHEHIKVLRVLADPMKAYQNIPKVRQAVDALRSTNSFAQASGDIPSTLLRPALPSIPDDHWEVLLDGLARFNLIYNLGATWQGWRQPAPGGEVLKKRTTPLGDRYIASITLPG